MNASLHASRKLAHLLDVGVGALVWNWPGGQAVMLPHTRLLVAVGGVVWNWLGGQAVMLPHTLHNRRSRECCANGFSCQQRIGKANKQQPSQHQTCRRSRWVELPQTRPGCRR
jgi:hypothetical protein